MSVFAHWSSIGASFAAGSVKCSVLPSANSTKPNAAALPLQEREIRLVVLEDVRMHLRRLAGLCLQADFARDLLHQVAVAHVLERAYVFPARQPVQPVERANDQTVRLLREVRLELDDLAVEQRALGA